MARNGITEHIDMIMGWADAEPDKCVSSISRFRQYLFGQLVCCHAFVLLQQLKRTL